MKLHVPLQLIVIVIVTCRASAPRDTVIHLKFFLHAQKKTFSLGVFKSKAKQNQNPKSCHNTRNTYYMIGMEFRFGLSLKTRCLP